MLWSLARAVQLSVPAVRNKVILCQEDWKEMARPMLQQQQRLDACQLLLAGEPFLRRRLLACQQASLDAYGLLEQPRQVSRTQLSHGTKEMHHWKRPDALWHQFYWPSTAP